MDPLRQQISGGTNSCVPVCRRAGSIHLTLYLANNEEDPIKICLMVASAVTELRHANFQWTTFLMQLKTDHWLQKPKRLKYFGNCATDATCVVERISDMTVADARADFHYICMTST